MNENISEAAKDLVRSEYSNADLIAAVIGRLRQVGPDRTRSVAITHLQTALLWMHVVAGDLP